MSSAEVVLACPWLPEYVRSDVVDDRRASSLDLSGDVPDGIRFLRYPEISEDR